MEARGSVYGGVGLYLDGEMLFIRMGNTTVSLYSCENEPAGRENWMMQESEGKTPRGPHTSSTSTT